MNVAKLRILLAISAAATAVHLFAGCERGQAEAPEGPQGLPVEVQQAKTMEMQRELLLTGTIKTRQDATITAGISEDVVSVRVREGDSVRAGEGLIQLDRTVVSRKLQQARASLLSAEKRLALLRAGARTQELAVARNAVEAARQNAEKAELDLERARQLYREGALAEAELDSARTDYEVLRSQYESAQEQYELLQEGARREEIEAAEAAVEQARAAVSLAQNDLDNTIIRSPISGVVYYRAVDIGDIPSVGTPLLKIADLGDLYMLATVPERDFHKLEAGQPVTVFADAIPDEPFGGSIEKLVPVAESGTREFTARVTVQNRENLLRPGIFVRGRVLLETHPQAVVVPSIAVLGLNEAESPKVIFVVGQNSTVERREIRLGIENTERVEVLSGVRPGERVVTMGQQGLESGQQVAVKE